MRVAAVGIGGAGGRIIDTLYQDNASRSVSYLTGVSALDTDQAALSALTAVPEDSRHVFGQVKTKGAGTDGDRELAIAAAEADLLETRRAIDSAITSDTDAIILAAGLGGGIGSGATHRFAKALKDVYEIPIYTVSVLPAPHEDVPPENPAWGLQALHSVVDAQLIFDNKVWLDADAVIDEAADELNQTLVQRLGALFSAGEAATAESVGQRVVDSSEIIATLDTGGLATLGYAQQDIRGDHHSRENSLVGRVRTFLSGTDESVDEVKAIKAIETTLRRATRGRLSFNCPLEAAKSGLLVVSGPPAWLHQSAIADGQTWLSEEIQSAQLRMGDDPVPNGDTVAVLVLFAGIRDTPRLDELRQ